VRNTRGTENQDIPEGTLDALMQTIVCKDVIGMGIFTVDFLKETESVFDFTGTFSAQGWRNGSRKLIVVATDGPFHIAGDGKVCKSVF
jgi:hypothetical protein